MRSENVRIGVIGLGVMGAAHARMISSGQVPGLKLTAVSDHTASHLDPYRDIACFESGEELIASDKVDAVLVATPHYSHTPLGIATLRAGHHLMMEKPISVHKEDCEKLISAYRPDSGQVFAAMFNQRTNPRFRKLRELLHDGVLGEVRRIQWTITSWFRSEYYYQSSGWRATWAGEGGGVLLNQSPHNLDMWQWLFGMPERVFARCQIGRFHDIEVEDSVTALFEYSSGTQGVFVTSTGEAPGTNRLEIAGDNGRMVIDAMDEHISFTRNEVPTPEFSRQSKRPTALPPVWNVSIPINGTNERYLGILKNFVAAIRGEEKLIAPAEEGIRSVELANAMLLSSFRDCPIRLPLDAAEYAAELKKRSS